MSRTVVHRWHCLRVVTLVASWAVVCCFFGLALSTAQASIMLPEAKAIDVEKLVADTNEGAGSTSASRAHEAPFDKPSENPAESELVRLMAAALSPVEGSTSSNSTSGSGNGGSGNSPIQSLSFATIPNLALLGWIAGEARFALPMPPGTDLLRPPQG